MARNQAPRLRSPIALSPLHVVLVEPEIPPNTGNVARLCAATASVLHLVGTLGFRIDEKSVRRAGIDYWHLVDVRQHLDLTHLRHSLPAARWVLFSASAEKSYLDAKFQPGDALLFGRESVGLPDDLLEQHRDSVYGIPTLGEVRSLNLANAVSIVLYEALRQIGALDKTFMG
jgi:tRNA (cytidine/uridine-2'-O-)-methyltransferase